MNKHNHIKNRDAYFKKARHNMFLKERNKQKIIDDNEIPVGNQSAFSNLVDDFDLDKEVAKRNLLGWIDVIENQKLHAAVTSLPLEEQTLLSYIFDKEMTQRELEKIYKLNHSTISRKAEQIIQKLRNIL